VKQHSLAGLSLIAAFVGASCARIPLETAMPERTPVPFLHAEAARPAPAVQSASVAPVSPPPPVSTPIPTEVPVIAAATPVPPAPPAAPPKATRNVWAVLVGISDYQFKGEGGVAPLQYADKDARDLAEALKQSGWPEYSIRLLTNADASKRNVEVALENWLSKAGPDDLILLYWSGHGFPDPDDPTKVYFACYDTNPHATATGYRMDRVVNTLRERGARNVVVMADTCHAGKLITRDSKRNISIATIDSMTQQKPVPRGWIYMVGAESDRQAIESSSWSNGAFTRVLLEGLGGEADGFQSAGPKDGIITTGELKEFLYSRMPDETQRVLGTAKRPTITTSSGDPAIWDLPLARHAQ